MYSELVAKRNSILDQFKKAHQELCEVNTQIDAEVAEANKKIAELQKETASLNTLKTQNAGSIKSLKKILGE